MEKRGGPRPGSGRKAKSPDEKRVQMVITVDRKTRDALRWVSTHRHTRPGKTVDILVGRHLDDDLDDI